MSDIQLASAKFYGISVEQFIQTRGVGHWDRDVVTKLLIYFQF